MRIVTLHSDDPAAIAAAHKYLIAVGWQHFADGNFPFAGRVGLTLGTHLSDDCRRAWRHHQPIIIPE